MLRCTDLCNGKTIVFITSANLFRFPLMLLYNNKCQERCRTQQFLGFKQEPSNHWTVKHFLILKPIRF